MSDEKTPYDLCGDGPYHPFRDHDTQFGWGVRHRTGAIFAYVGAKGCAHGLAAALNGHWDAAKVFLNGDIPDEYFERFTGYVRQTGGKD